MSPEEERGDDTDAPSPPGAAPAATPPGGLPTDDAEELYDSAPCGYLSTLMDGTIVRINATLLRWLGLERGATVGRKRFADLLTAGGRLYHETHFAPLLRIRGEIGGLALELRAADGSRLPVLVSSSVKHDAEGEPQLIRTTVFEASDRRSYEEELLRQRKAADQARGRAEEASRRAEQAQREAERAQREAEAARGQADGARTRLEETFRVLQQALLPPELPTVPGVELDCHYRPASPDRVGGDFYDVFEIGADRWAFFLGDVSGHGPEAAAVTSQARYTLRAAALHDQDPLGALSVLNDALCENNAGGDGDPRYCTAVVGFLEPDRARGEVRVRLASGGHPPALVLRATGGAEYLVTPGGMLVGVVPDADFVSAATTLGAGDTMLLYTDGLTEAHTGAGPGELFGGDGLLDFARAFAGCGAKRLVAEVRALLDRFGAALDDDTALLAFGAPVPRRGAPRRPGRAAAPRP
ncbi:SpoIIE family protein phosphatase [Streptomyces sp. MJP52]|uniref:PP2C family protein-serine/threonine phosphatase n=2 Tax=Streptomyces TaxID=1883 RepID=UPI002474981C|nr:SpoIIE family protein phosphatase [Streptomyces sp. MJP52]MDH6228293.1 sigma-B regulation protein RsbU (phosphoserine phosphatase) [Streptomyces sp. MJP52]